MNNYRCRFAFYKDMIPADDLTAVVEDLGKVGIELKLHDETGMLKAFLDDFTNQIFLQIPPELVKDIKTAVITSVCYDVLKTSIICIWDKLKGKKITKYYAYSEPNEIEATFGLKVNIDDLTTFDMRLSGDVPEELKAHVVDQAFDLIKNKNSNTRPRMEYARYDIAQQKWEVIDVVDEIRKRKGQELKQCTNYVKEK